MELHPVTCSVDGGPHCGNTSTKFGKFFPSWALFSAVAEALTLKAASLADDKHAPLEQRNLSGNICPFVLDMSLRCSGVLDGLS